MCEQFLNSSQRYQHFSEKICLFQMLTLNSLVYAGKQNLLQSLSISHTRLKTELQNLHLIEISYLLVIFLIMCRAFTPYKYLHRHGHCPLNFRFSWIMAYKVENGRMFNWIHPTTSFKLQLFCLQAACSQIGWECCLLHPTIGVWTEQCDHRQSISPASKQLISVSLTKYT